jgi:hypothetical protein
MSVTVTIRSNKLPPMPAKLQAAVRDITKKALFDVVAIADPLTPVDTGHLKNAKEITADSVHWLADYAAYQDKGTVHVPPRLFATTAAERVGPQWQRALADIEGRLV